MKIEDVEDTAIPQSTSDGLQSVSKPSPVDDGYHVIDGLPSQCRFYTANTKIYGRPLKVIEVKQLAGMNVENADSLINSVLRRAVKGIDIDKILVADKLFILLWLRGTTYKDSEFGIDFKCQLCQTESKYSLSLEKIETKQISDDFATEKLTFKIPSGDEITFSFPTIAEENIASSFVANCSYIKDIDADIVGQCVLIKQINGENLSMLEKYNFISRMSPPDYVFFLSYIEHYSFGIKWIIQAKCSHCGGDSPMGILFLSDGNFWLPRINISKN